MDLSFMVEKYKSHAYVDYLKRVIDFYETLKLIKPSSYSRICRYADKSIYKPSQFNEAWMIDGIESYTLILLRFSIFMSQMDFLSAYFELDDMTTKYNYDFSNSTILNVTIVTIEDELWKLAQK